MSEKRIHYLTLMVDKKCRNVSLAEVGNGDDVVDMALAVSRMTRAR
jgi:hypothetical protein